ncbi:MAG: hypothetical protein LLG06_19770 [Desulfobacteraceae bacterium]|nr:hypothetical protein [Desulfobacteraceae bacterium]
MALSVNSKTFSVFGDKAAVFANLAFDNSYVFGGESLDHDQQLGLHDIETVLFEQKNGYSFVHDAANKKIKVFAHAPAVVYEEKQTPNSDIITLKYPAAFIMNVAISGQNKVFRSTGIGVSSLSDNQCSLVSQMAAGTRTQLTVKDWDRLAGDGAFTTAATNWTFSDSKNDWTEASDALNKDQDGVETITHDNFAAVVGRTYRLTFTISGWSVGTVTSTLGGTSGTAVGADGTYTQEITAVTTGGLVFTPSNTSRFTLDSVTVYDLSEPVYVTYVTQAWKDVWDNLVQDETITLATGANTPGEVITTVANRDMSGASSWTNGNVNAYNETNDITVTANAIGQYFYLLASACTTVPGTAYRLTLDVANIAGTWAVYDALGSQLIATITANGTKQTFDFTAETYGGLRFVALAANSSADFDNFSLSPGNELLACMYVDQTTATAAALTMIDEDDTAASGEVALAFGTPLNQLTVHSAQNAKAAKITYIKKPTSGFLADRAFVDETATKVGADPYLNTFAKPILLWGYAGQLPVNGGTTQRMIDFAATPGAGEFTIDFFNGNNRGTPTTPTGAGDSHNHAFTGTAQAPMLKCEEAVTVTTNAGTLAHVPLYIIAVQVTAGDVTGAFSVIPTGETPATKQVAVTFTTGAMAFKATDNVSSVKVTYIPKRGSGFLSSVTVDEAVTAAAAKANLAARAGLVQYVWDDTDGVLVDFEQPGTAPSATHFCTVDINDTGNSSIDSHADDEANALKVTYVPFTQLPPGCFIDDTDITLSSEVWNFTGDPLVNGYNNLVVPGFGVQAIGETGAAARAAAVWQGPSGTAANGVATWNPATNAIATDNTTAITILSIPWMILSPLFLTPTTPAGSNAAESTHIHAITATTSYGSIFDVKSNVTGTGAGVWGRIDEVRTVPLEVVDGDDLSALDSVKCVFFGT